MSRLSLHRALPFLSWPRLTSVLLRGEVMAGLAVGLTIIPQGVAYAQLSGMPAVTGIYAALLPPLIGVLFAASPRVSVGPSALSCLLVFGALAPLATPESAEWVSLAVWLALLSGLLQVALGAVRFGWLLNVVNSPVLMAFTQAAALLILASQLPQMLGFKGGWQAFAQAPALDPLAAAFGLGTLALLLGMKRWAPRLPALVMVVLATAGLSYVMGFEARGGSVVGALPAGLPALSLPSWPGWQTLGQLVMPALIVTLVSFLETASSAKVDNQLRGTRWNSDQDLIAQGLAKITSGLSGSFPTSSSFSRSALNLYAGAKSGWATVFSVVVVLLALLLFTPVLRYVPRAVLAAIVVMAVLSLMKPREFTRLWQVSRVEAVIAGVTFVVTLVTAPALYWGVLAGVLMALSNFLFQRLHPRIIEVGLHPDGSLRDRHLWHLPALAPHTYALRMDAALDFAASNRFERALVEYLAAHPDTRHVALFAQPINRIDATGAEVFVKLLGQLRDRRITMHLAGVKLPVERVLLAAGALAPHPLLLTYRTDAEALAALRAIADAECELPADLAAMAI